MRRTISRAALFCAVLGCLMSAGRSGVIAQQRPDGNQWTTYSGNDSAQRHSPLTQITPANVGRLTVQWMFQTGVQGRLEATPLVVDGIMYLTGPDNLRLGPGCADRSTDLALPAAVARASQHLLRAGQSRFCDPRRSSLHDHARRPSRGARYQDWQRPLRRRDRRSHEKLYRDRRAAHRERQGDCRNRGSRVRHPRIHRRLRCEHREEGLAILDRSRAWTAW